MDTQGREAGEGAALTGAVTADVELLAGCLATIKVTRYALASSPLPENEAVRKSILYSREELAVMQERLEVRLQFDKARGGVA